MTERDAFGNLVGGAGPTATAPAPPPRPPRPPRRPRQWLRALASLAATAVVLTPIGVGGWLAYGAIHDATRDGGVFATHPSTTVQSSSSSTTSSTTSTTSDGKATPAPRGLAAGSLLRPAAFARMLAAARRASGGQLRLLRLAPARADLQLARAGGGLTLLQLRWNGDRTLIKTPGSMGSTKTITYAGIDRSAPQRLVTAAAHRLHRSTNAIDYVVLIDALGAPMWSAYFVGGAAFQGDAHGHIAQRIQ